MADGDSSNREVRVVTLVIKNPSTTSLGDFRMQMPVEATVLAVKQRLQRDYQGNPEPSKQKLIVGGQFVKDYALIREVFKQKDLTEPLMMHLMVSSSGTESSPLTTSTPTFSSSSPIPSSSPAISSANSEQADRNSRQVATSPSPSSSPSGVTSNNVSQVGIGRANSHGGNEVSASRPQESASPSQNFPPTLATNATSSEAMGQTSGLVSGTATQGGGASSSTTPSTDGFAPMGAPGPSQTTSTANPGGVGRTGVEGSAFPAGPLPPETVNLAMLQMMYGGMMLNPLAYSPAMAAYNAALLNPAAFGGLGPHYPGYMAPFCPPAMVPPYFPAPGDQQQQQRQQAGGIFAMPPLPGGGMGAAGFGVMPFNVPLGAPFQAMPQGVQEAGQMGPPMARRPQAEEAYVAQAARLRQRHGPAAGAAIPVQENAIGGQAMFVQHIGQDGRPPVVRRIRIHLRLDLMLIAKLAVLVFAFNQGGEASRTRTLLLSGAAVLFYLYQTGALAPLHRWFAQGTRHVLGQPLQPPPAEPQNNGLGNQARGAAAGAVPVGGQGTGLGPEEPPLQQQRDRRGILREIQVFFMGFLVSLLPGFHAPDEPLVREPEDLAQPEGVPNPPRQD